MKTCIKKGVMLHAGTIYCFFEAKYEIITSQQDWFIDILISELISTNFSQYREPLMYNQFSEFDYFVQNFVLKENVCDKLIGMKYYCQCSL